MGLHYANGRTVTGQIIVPSGDIADPSPSGCDVRSAESRKYGNVGLWLVPLASGNWGVFDGAYRLIGTTSGGLPGDDELAVLAHVWAERLKSGTPRTAGSLGFEEDTKAKASVGSFDDLGL